MYNLIVRSTGQVIGTYDMPRDADWDFSHSLWTPEQLQLVREADLQHSSGPIGSPCPLCDAGENTEVQ